MHYQFKLLERARSILQLFSKKEKQLPPQALSTETESGPFPLSPSPSSHNFGHKQALALAAELRGQTFRVPDLRTMFEDWPLATSKYAKELVPLVNSILDRHIDSEKKLQALKKADFAKFIAL